MREVRRTTRGARRTPCDRQGVCGTLLAAACASPRVAPARQRGRVGKGWQCAQRSRTAGEHGARSTLDARVPLDGCGHTQNVASMARTPHRSGAAHLEATTSRCAFLRTGLAVGAGTVGACLGHDPQWIHVDVSRPGGEHRPAPAGYPDHARAVRLQRRGAARVRNHSPDAGSGWGPSRQSMRSRPTGCSSGSRRRSVPH